MVDHSPFPQLCWGKGAGGIGERVIHRQPQDQIIARARVLGALLQRGFYTLHGASAEAAPWGLDALVSAGMWAAASALERRLLTLPVGELSEELAREAMWSGEALAVLCWAMGLRAAPEQDVDVAPYSVLAVLPQDAAGWGALSVVREDEALERALWRWFWVHRRVVRFMCQPGPFELREEIEAHPRSPDPDALGLVLTPVEGDLEVWEEPLGALAVEALPYGREFARVSASRLRALRWLCGVGGGYEAVGDNPFDPWSALPTEAALLIADHLATDDALEARAWGTTPAHLASARGEVEALGAALSSGAEPGAVDVLGETITHVAAREGQLETLLVALDAGGMIDAPGCSGRTPLHLACARRDLDALDALLARAGDRDPVDYQRQTPLMLAIAARWHEGVRALLAARASKNGFIGVEPALHHAVAARDLVSVRALLEHGADRTRPNALGQTPREHAAAIGWHAGADALKS